MKYAVIKISGSQYLVKEGQVLTLDNQKLAENKKTATKQVLLFADGQTLKIGAPVLSGIEVRYQIIKNYKGKKLRVSTYRAKSRYRKVKGFRPRLTDIKIISIKETKSKTGPAKSDA